MRFPPAYGLVAGLALLSLAAPANAADLPSRRAPPVYVPPPVVAWSWTGFQGGLHSSYIFGGGNRATTTGRGTPAGDVRPRSVNTERQGFGNVGGGIAYNYQFTPGSGIVVGASADADWVGLYENNYTRANATQLSYYRQRLSVLGTVNGRLGYAFDRFLVYGTGGFAYGDPGYSGAFLAPNGNVRYFGGNNGQLRGGYNFGGGLMYAIPNDSIINKFSIEKYLGLDRMLGINSATVLKVEYIHYDLGSSTVVFNPTAGNAGSYAVRYRTEGNQIRAGLVYSIGSPIAAPVVARY